MRGYVEQLEREHFNHGDDCRCEVSEDPKRDYYHEQIDYEALEEEETQRRISYGMQPHGGRNAFGDGCECDLCEAWHVEQENQTEE